MPERVIFPPDAARMHRFDPAMTQMILDYVVERLSIEENSVDGLGDRRHLERVVEGLIGDQPRDAREVLDVYVDHLALHHPLGRQPAHVHVHPVGADQGVAAVRHGRVGGVPAGLSWLEAAGAVMAENQALRCDRRHGRAAAEAGGVFVSGGSAGNLSALVVARDTVATARIEAGLPDIRCASL